MIYFLAFIVLILFVVVVLVVGEVNDLRSKVYSTVRTIDECNSVLRECESVLYAGMRDLRTEFRQFVSDQKDDSDDFWRGE